MIPESTVRDILEAAQTVDIVGDYVSLRKRGSNMIGLCPFHGERTPSFTVSPSKNIYKCFGCGRAGDSVTFLREHEQMTYPEALRHLAARYGIEIEEVARSPEEQLAYDHRTWLLGVMDFAAKHYHQSLSTGEGRAIGKSYFTNRGLLDKTIQDFDLGYADPQQSLSAKLQTMGYETDQLKEAGLMNRGDRDFFFKRAIFPIHNASGKVIALAGRIIGDQNGPKYINSPDSLIYDKSKVLYGLHLAKVHIKRDDRCYMAEGYMDVLSLHQNGIPHAIATSGTALTADHVRIIKRYTQHVVLLFDGDAAGQQATVKGVRQMLAQDVNVYIVSLPSGDDPDTMVNRLGHEAFKQYLDEQETDFITFYAKIKLAEAPDDPVQRTAFVQEVIELIAIIPNEIKQVAYIQQLSSLIGMSEELLMGQLSKALRQQQYEQQKQAQRERRRAERAGTSTAIPTGTPTETDPHIHEHEVIRVLLLGGEKILDDAGQISVRDYIMEQLKDINELTHPLYNQIYLEIIAQSDAPFSREYFMHHPDEQVREVLHKILADVITISPNWADKWGIHLQTQPQPEDNFFAMSQQAVLRLQLDRLQQIADENVNVIKTLEDEDDIERHLAIQQKINEMKADLTRQLGMIVMPG